MPSMPSGFSVLKRKRRRQNRVASRDELLNCIKELDPELVPDCCKTESGKIKSEEALMSVLIEGCGYRELIKRILSPKPNQQASDTKQNEAALSHEQASSSGDKFNGNSISSRKKAIEVAGKILDLIVKITRKEYTASEKIFKRIDDKLVRFFLEHLVFYISLLDSAFNNSNQYFVHSYGTRAFEEECVAFRRVTKGIYHTLVACATLIKLGTNPSRIAIVTPLTELQRMLEAYYGSQLQAVIDARCYWHYLKLIDKDYPLNTISAQDKAAMQARYPLKDELSTFEYTSLCSQLKQKLEGVKQKLKEVKQKLKEVKQKRIQKMKQIKVEKPKDWPTQRAPHKSVLGGIKQGVHSPGADHLLLLGLGQTTSKPPTSGKKSIKRKESRKRKSASVQRESDTARRSQIPRSGQPTTVEIEYPEAKGKGQVAIVSQTSPTIINLTDEKHEIPPYKQEVLDELRRDAVAEAFKRPKKSPEKHKVDTELNTLFRQNKHDDIADWVKTNNLWHKRCLFFIDAENICEIVTPLTYCIRDGNLELYIKLIEAIPNTVSLYDVVTCVGKSYVPGSTAMTREATSSLRLKITYAMTNIVFSQEQKTRLKALRSLSKGMSALLSNDSCQAWRIEDIFSTLRRFCSNHDNGLIFYLQAVLFCQHYDYFASCQNEDIMRGFLDSRKQDRCDALFRLSLPRIDWNSCTIGAKTPDQLWARLDYLKCRGLKANALSYELYRCFQQSQIDMVAGLLRLDAVPENNASQVFNVETMTATTVFPQLGCARRLLFLLSSNKEVIQCFQESRWVKTYLGKSLSKLMLADYIRTKSMVGMRVTHNKIEIGGLREIISTLFSDVIRTSPQSYSAPISRLARVIYYTLQSLFGDRAVVIPGINIDYHTVIGANHPTPKLISTVIENNALRSFLDRCGPPAPSQRNPRQSKAASLAFNSNQTSSSSKSSPQGSPSHMLKSTTTGCGGKRKQLLSNSSAEQRQLPIQSGTTQPHKLPPGSGNKPRPHC